MRTAALLLAAVTAASPNPALFTRVAEQALATHAAPGIALAVVRNGQIVYERGYGYANVAAKTPVTPRTRFAIGSLTKQFTAAAILLLAERHRLSLDDSLAKYVPSLPNARTITLRMLLNQTSGLHNYPKMNEHDWPTQGTIPLSRIIAILATDKPDFAPGTKWEYSNANYAALAAVVGKASGVPYASFVSREILQPLGMHASGVGYAAQQSGTAATGYVQNAPETPALSLDLYSGAGAMISSAHDLARWDIALMNGTLLPKSAVAKMWRKGRANGAPVDYGMGWVPATVAGHREVWHNGLAPGAGGYCFNAIFPDDGLAVVVLTNGFGASGVPEHMVAQIAAAYGIGNAAAKPLPTTAPGDDPKIDALARGFWNQLASGSVDRTAVTPAFSAQLTPSLLAQASQGIALLGPLRAFTFVGSQAHNGVVGYGYKLTFVSGVTRTWVVVIGSDGKIAGSGFQP